MDNNAVEKVGECEINPLIEKKVFCPPQFVIAVLTCEYNRFNAIDIRSASPLYRMSLPTQLHCTTANQQWVQYRG